MIRLELIGPGGHDDVESIGSGGPVEAEALPSSACRPRHVAEFDYLLLRVSMMK